MFEDKDETILARWLAGELTSEELAEFEQSEEFREYQQIARGMESFKKPAFHKEQLRDKVQGKLDHGSKGKVRYLKPLLYVSSVAASLLLVLGIFFDEVSYTTATGQQLSAVLPDGSQVQLNAQSVLTHKRFFWNSNKKVSLKGEAFFSIEKGDGFSVQTTSGTVSVLGTRFNIRARKSTFELVCYEGKVQFDAVSIQEKAILIEGDVLRLEADQLERERTDSEKPSWTGGKSTFNNSLLIHVIEELEIQYGIKIQHSLGGNTDHFTGSFVHDELEIALKSVFVPMGIDYVLAPDKKTVVLKLP